ncbi:MAG: HAD family phosphatase [Chloroflexota bacterium]|nr:MAG: HAD family phosphatase [Chloroflexota bacterium]
MNAPSSQGDCPTAGYSSSSPSGLRVQAVIFDVDGLMVDSEPLQTQAWDIYLEPFGHRIGPAEKALLLGRRVIESAAVLKSRLDLPGEPEAIVAARRPILFSLIREKLRPMPGLYDLTAACARLGLATAVASSSYADYVALVLRLTNLESRFAAVVTGDQVKSGKPDPEVFVRAADCLAVHPSRCLVLEDSPNGVLAAKRAGMWCAAINASPAAMRELSAADVIRPQLGDVIPDIVRWANRAE